MIDGLLASMAGLLVMQSTYEQRRREAMAAAWGKAEETMRRRSSGRDGGPPRGSLPAMEAPRRYRIGELLFDASTGELVGPAGENRLPPKAARLLALLLERPGELVSRDRLRAELWPEQHVEIDQALAYTVRQIRAALGDDGAEPRFVETLPRRGYRLLVPAEPVDAEADAGAELAAPVPVRQVSPGRRWSAPAAAGALVVLLALAGWAWQRGARAPADAGTSSIRIAVLPLGAPGEAVDEPLTEALVVALTAQPTLDVVARRPPPALRGTLRPHGDVGRELGVAFVASGGYREADQLLFLQLVRVADGKHVFARRYLGAPPEVQRQLGRAAAEIAAAAAASLGPPAKP